MTILDLPMMILDVHPVCNQTCAYCVSGSAPTNEFGPVTNRKTLQQLDKFFGKYGPFNVIFTGGEPLITPGISDIFAMLLKHGHYISLQSNLKSRIETFFNVVPPERTGWVLTAFHSVELKRFDSYLAHVLTLKGKGYPVIVKLVLDDLMMTEFVSVHDTLTANNLATLLSPLVYFPPSDLSWPKQYTPAEWALITPRISLLSSWLYFAGGFNSLGMSCNAGRQLSLMRVWNGTVHGCSHSFPENIGSLTVNTFTPSKGAVSCGLQQCVCDFHYYTGIIPGLDDTRQFKKLLTGTHSPVSFEAYQQWLADIGIEPIIDLASEMKGTSRKVILQQHQPVHITPEQIVVSSSHQPENRNPPSSDTQPAKLRLALSKVVRKISSSVFPPAE